MIFTSQIENAFAVWPQVERALRASHSERACEPLLGSEGGLTELSHVS